MNGAMGGYGYGYKPNALQFTYQPTINTRPQTNSLSKLGVNRNKTGELSTQNTPNEFHEAIGYDPQSYENPHAIAMQNAAKNALVGVVSSKTAPALVSALGIANPLLALPATYAIKSLMNSAAVDAPEYSSYEQLGGFGLGSMSTGNALADINATGIHGSFGLNPSAQTVSYQQAFDPYNQFAMMSIEDQMANAEFAAMASMAAEQAAAGLGGMDGGFGDFDGGVSGVDGPGGPEGPSGNGDMLA